MDDLNDEERRTMETETRLALAALGIGKDQALVRRVTAEAEARAAQRIRAARHDPRADERREAARVERERKQEEADVRRRVLEALRDPDL